MAGEDVVLQAAADGGGAIVRDEARSLIEGVLNIRRDQFFPCNAAIREKAALQQTDQS